jgi:hypothetical protein
LKDAAFGFQAQNVNILFDVSRGLRTVMNPQHPHPAASLGHSHGGLLSPNQLAGVTADDLRERGRDSFRG